MKITNIKKQLQRSDRYSVFIDKKFAFGLSAQSLLDLQLVPGEEIDTKRYHDIKDKSAEDSAFNRALSYATRSLRSKWEVQQYLLRSNIKGEIAEKIINKLIKLKIIDDKEYALRYVNNTNLLKPTSIQKIRYSLKQKRVAQELVDNALSSSESNDRIAIKELIAKKQRISRYKDKQKLMAYLARQGFNYADIKQVYDEMLIDSDIEN